jgi:hypothetical protein
MIYFAYAHSIIGYGIAFWGNATNSKSVFIVQKIIIRSIMNANPRATCRGFFKYLNILPFYSQYILNLPLKLRVLSNDFNKYKSAINALLLNQSFYLLNEYMEWSKERK